MEPFILDPNTVKDCAEHPAAASYASDPAPRTTQPGKGHQLIFQEPEVQMSSERCDSAYCGSDCLSTGSRLFSNISSATGSVDVSERLRGLHLEHHSCQDQTSSQRQKDSKPSSIVNERTSPTALSGRPQAQKRPADVLEELVLSSDAYDQDEEGDTPLSQSIICEKPEITLKFIRFTPDPRLFNIRNCMGQTPLMLSVLTHQDKVCRALVVAGASVDIQDKEGNTSLHLACALRNFKCVQALTSKIHPVEIKNTLSPRNHRHPQSLTSQLGLKNYEGLTCVHLAAFQANVNLLQYLVSLGANINEPDGKSGRTALHYAVEMNSFNLVQALVSTLGADIDAVTYDLCTPLHLAAGRGHLDVACMLHGAGADTQVQNFEGQCACELTDNADLRDLLTPRQAFDHPHIDFVF